MKIMAALILMIGVSILLVAGLAALQYQGDVGDTIINESSPNYDTYQQVRETGRLEMQIAGYLPMLLLLFLLVAILMVAVGTVAMIKFK